MVTDSISEFVETLREHQLLDESQLLRLHEEAKQCASVRDLAKLAVRQGLLTRFQAKQIISGKAGELKLGAYRLIDRLGEGGMGQVYKALHTAMGRLVALKVVRPELVADSKTIRRFQREVQSAAQLSHPHIVTVFDAANVGNVHFLAMEYIDGIDVADLIRHGGPLPVAQACDYVRQAALGLQHAHERGLIHRDIKPSNLLITRNPTAGTVKILDMGLARPCRLETTEGLAKTTLTLEGTVVGTPDFMAPEQAKNASRVDHRSDLYSLGCTLYFMLAGRQPFAGATAMEKLIQHQFEQPCPVEMLRNDVSPGVVAVLNKLMAKKPEDRYPSAAEVVAAIAPYCDREVASHTLSPASSPTANGRDNRPDSTFRFYGGDETAPTNGKPRKRSQSFGWLLVASGLAALVAGGFLLAVGNQIMRARRAAMAAPAVTTPATKAEPQPTPKGPAATTANDPFLASIQDDAGVVLVFQTQRFLDAPLVKKHFLPLLKPLFEQLAKVQIDPARQFERVTISTSTHDADRVLVVFTGSHRNNGISRFLSLLPREEKRFANGSKLSIHEIREEGKSPTFLALFGETQLAVSGSKTSLWEMHERWNGKPTPPGAWQSRLAGWKNEAPLMLAVGPAYAPNDATLESLGVHFFRCEATLTPTITLRCVADVDNPEAFRKAWQSVLDSGSKNFFDVKRRVLMTIWRKSEFQPAKKLANGRHEVQINVNLNELDSEIMAKYIANQIQSK